VIEALEKARGLAEAHWSFIEELLKTHGESEDVIRKCEFHYKSAFRHGFKHGLEYALGLKGDKDG